MGTISPKFIVIPSFPSSEDIQADFAGLVANFGTLFPLSHPEAVMNLHLMALHAQLLPHFVHLLLPFPNQFLQHLKVCPFLRLSLFFTHSRFDCLTVVLFIAMAFKFHYNFQFPHLNYVYPDAYFVFKWVLFNNFH